MSVQSPSSLSLSLSMSTKGPSSYLLTTNGKLALRFLVRVGKGLELLDRLTGGQDRQGEPDVGLCVLVPGLEAVRVVCG